MIAAGFSCATREIDLLVDCSPEDDALIRKGLENLPDQAVLEIGPG